jgi:hypothetical protein
MFAQDIKLTSCGTPAFLTLSPCLTGPVEELFASRHRGQWFEPTVCLMKSYTKKLCEYDPYMITEGGEESISFIKYLWYCYFHYRTHLVICVP